MIRRISSDGSGPRMTNESIASGQCVHLYVLRDEEGQSNALGMSRLQCLALPAPDM